MSHGHDHKDYKAVFGDVEKGTKGLYVLCDGYAPKSGTDVHQTTRLKCLVSPMPACKSCEHSNFVVKLRLGVGDQKVACPRWNNIEDRLNHVFPKYEIIRRELCITRRPFEYCSSCPNKDATMKPQTEPGWWEERGGWKEDK